jgi:anti-anti-sigma factor
VTTKIKRTGSIAILEPVGELRRESSEVLAEALDKALALQGIDTVVISFKEVTALLSEGIRRLVTLRDQALKAKCRFHITDLPPDVRYTLKITNLLEFLNHVDVLNEIVEKKKRSDTAILKKAQVEGRASMPQAPTQKTTQKPEAKPAPAPAAPATKPPEPPKPEKEPDLTEKELQELIAQYLPGRMAVEVVEQFLKKHESVFSAPALAAAIGVKENAIRKVAAQLIHCNVLKEIAQNTYNYAPDPQLAKKLDSFFRLWHLPNRQPRILAMLLSVER